MVEMLRLVVGDYLLIFLMISSGMLFIIAGRNGEPIYQTIRRYFWRLVLWEMFITPLLFCIRLVLAKDATAVEVKEWTQSDVDSREKFLSGISQKTDQTVKKTWYMICWIWLEAKIKFACGVLIGMLSFGSPSIVMASDEQNESGNNEIEIATVINQKTEDNWSWSGQVTSWNSWTSDGANSNMQMFRLQRKSQNSQSGFEILQWKPDQVNEFLIWSDETKISKFGVGFQQSPSSGACYFEVNGIQSFKALGGNVCVFWQAKKGLSGNLSPDTFQINSAKITWSLGKNVQIGPDSKLKLVNGKKPVNRIGAILDWQITQDLKIRLRDFVEFQKIKSNFEIWLFYALPLGGAGP